MKKIKTKDQNACLKSYISYCKKRPKHTVLNKNANVNNVGLFTKSPSDKAEPSILRPRIQAESISALKNSNM
ncbi:MAG: hypothetical protein AAB679_01245 [Patescibacteria group bacterium]